MKHKNHIYYEDFKYSENSNLRDFLNLGMADNISKNIDEEHIIVLGGDGTMLSAIKKFHKKNIPFLGINFGHKGFLLNEKESVLKAKKYIKRYYPLLECTLQKKGKNHTFYAFNEIDIRSGNGRIVTLEITVGGNKGMHISGDGIVVSTPAGSTGYNSSLGGPILPHHVEAFVITPKAPWSPKGQGPILISNKETIQIKNIVLGNNLQMYGDSNRLDIDDESIHLTIKKSKKKVTFLIAENYIDNWDTKVMQEQGFSI